MAADIIKMKGSDGKVQYPVTSSEAVGMSDGSGNLDKKFATLGTQISNKIYDVLSTLSDNDDITVYSGIIDENGADKQWATTKRTEYISLIENTIVCATGIKTIPANQSVVAFYNQDGDFISEYNDYIGNFGGGSKYYDNIIIVASKYPLAKTCRISWLERTDGVPTSVKKYSIPGDLEDIKSRLTETEKNILELYTNNKVDITELISSTIVKQRYIRIDDGAISTWGTSSVYKIALPLPTKTIMVDNLKAINARCYLMAFYKGSDEFVSGFLTANSNEIKNGTILREEDIPKDAEYLALASSNDTVPVINDLSLNLVIEDIRKNIENSNKDINALYNLTSLKRVFSTVPGFINYEGVLSSWSNTKTTELIPIKGKAVLIDKITSIAGRIYLVSFYNEEGTILLDYKDYYVEDTGGAKTYTDLRITGDKYPLASFIKISGVNLDNAIVKYSDFESLDNRIGVLESSLSNADFSTGQNIYGVGDSIGSQILSAMVNNIGEIDGHKIVNGCVGGESTLDTLAKNNVIPYVVLPFTVPSTKTQSEALTVYSSRYLQTNIAEDGETLSYINTYKVGTDGMQSNSYGDGINPWNILKCIIGGIKGTLYFERGQPNRENNYFIREEEGEEVVFDRPQLVIPQELQSTQCIWVDFMGTNGGWSPIDNYDNFEQCADILVNYHEQLRNYFNHEKYVFLGFYMTAFLDQVQGEERIRRWKYFEDKMVEKFGKHYLSVRQYLREYGWRDAGYKLGYRLVDDIEGGEGAKKYACLPEDIAADQQAIKDGKIPYCIVNGPTGVHMLAKPSACVANQVVKRLFELGCIDSCPQIDISTIKDAENADINEPDYGN